LIAAMPSYDPAADRRWLLLRPWTLISRLAVVLWQLKKHDHPMIDAHGKNVANWLLSLLIYGAVACVLVFLLIGIPLLWLLGILNIVFAIVGGIKANDGVVWAYPFTIRFLS
jgi:uncharacterized Tic20 family protein